MSTKLKEERTMVSEKEVKILPLNFSNIKQEMVQNEALDYSWSTSQKDASPTNTRIRDRCFSSNDTISTSSSPSTSDSQSISSAPVSPSYQKALFGPSCGKPANPFHFPPSP